MQTFCYLGRPPERDQSFFVNQAPVYTGAWILRSKSEEKSEKKRPKTLASQKEAAGAHFSWSGVALGRPNGGPRDYGSHRAGPGPLRSGGSGLATSLRLGGSEDLRLRSEATQDLTRRRVGEFSLLYS